MTKESIPKKRGPKPNDLKGFGTEVLEEFAGESLPNLKTQNEKGRFISESRSKQIADKKAKITAYLLERIASPTQLKEIGDALVKKCLEGDLAAIKLYLDLVTIKEPTVQVDVQQNTAMLTNNVPSKEELLSQLQVRIQEQQAQLSQSEKEVIVEPVQVVEVVPEQKENGNGT